MYHGNTVIDDFVMVYAENTFYITAKKIVLSEILY